MTTDGVFDSKYIMSMMPDDLRVEVAERLHEDDDLFEWWSKRGEEDYTLLANWMMNDDLLWRAWNESFLSSARELKNIMTSKSTEV